MMKNMMIAAALLITTSCSSFKKIVEPPKVKLEDVRVTKMKFTGADLEVVLSVQNPNNIDFDVKNLVYKLDVADKEITSGKLTEKVLVKGNETTKVALPISLLYSDIIGSAMMFLEQKGMPYRVKGSVEIGPFTIPFDDDGTLKAHDL